MSTEAGPTPPEIDVPLAFEVRDAASANWVVRKIVEARKYAERVEAWAAAEIRRAQREEQFMLARFGPQLERWARQQIEEIGRRRSVSLPAGIVGFRTARPRLSIVDEQRLLAWCRTQLPSAIKSIEITLKLPLMEHLKATGECPNGMELNGGGERFFVK